LDYDGLQTYHSELVQRLTDLEYDPERLFASKTELCNGSKWGADKYGRIAGLKKGLIVTVDGKLWQLEDPATFGAIFRTINPYFDPESQSAEDLGWIELGVDFDVNNHILNLKK